MHYHWRIHKSTTGHVWKKAAMHRETEIDVYVNCTVLTLVSEVGGKGQRGRVCV